jgi:D-serine deaminase-like pyridoxal phosphate-dependent protein
VWSDSVPTPFVYVDLNVLDRNVEKMSAAASGRGIKLRPHAKTHKIAEIARMQLSAGASGLTVAKLSEAEAFAGAGILTSYMIAQPFVGVLKTQWLLDLARNTELLVCGDDLELARAMGEAAAASGLIVDFVLIIDTGYGRFGVDWQLGRVAVEQIVGLQGLNFRGIRSHAGHVYAAVDALQRQAIVRDEVDRVRSVAEAVRRQKIDCEIVSVGSTPSAQLLLANNWVDGITEVRPGNYVFHDTMQIRMGVATVEDCALRVVTSVVSNRRTAESVIDAGLKTLTGTLDGFASPMGVDYGLVVNRPEVRVVRLTEECGIVTSSEVALRRGDRLAIVPNHACEITNLAEVVFYGSNDTVEGFWAPAARSRVW